MSLQKKLTLYILLMTGILLLAVCTTGYWSSKKQLTVDIDARMAAIADQQAQQIDSWLLRKAGKISDLAFVIGNVTQQDVPAAFLILDKNDKSISDIYIGFEADGKFIHGEGSPMPGDYDPRKRGWYKEAVQKNALGFSEPYVDLTTKKYCVSPSLPIKDSNGNLRGVVGGDILLETLSDMIKKSNLDGKGYAFILDAKGIMLAHPDEKMVSKSLLENEPLKNLAKTMLDSKDGSTTYQLDGESKMAVYRKIPSTGWILGFTVLEKDVYAPLNSLRNLYIGITVVALLFIVLATMMLAKKIVAPIKELTEHAKQIADGNLTVQAEVKGNDEIAVLGQAFNQMGENLKKLIQEVQNMAGYMMTSSGDMRNAAKEAGDVSEQIATTITEMAQDSTKQAEGIQHSADMIVDMTTSVNIITKNIVESNSTAESVKSSVSTGSNAVEQQVGLMEKNQKAAEGVQAAIGTLSEKSQKIGQIVEVITGIAGQTNLLALNAAIEAARAGEHGRGFAVVAEEVRKLAEQAERSSQEITYLIREIQENTDQAVLEMKNGVTLAVELEKAAKISHESLMTINQSVGEFVRQIQHISQEVEQVDRKAEGVSKAIGDVAVVADNNAAATEEVAAATQEQTASVQSIAQEAKKLAEQAEVLNNMITKFTL